MGVWRKLLNEHQSSNGFSPELVLPRAWQYRFARARFSAPLNIFITFWDCARFAGQLLFKVSFLPTAPLHCRFKLLDPLLLGTVSLQSSVRTRRSFGSARSRAGSDSLSPVSVGPDGLSRYITFSVRQCTQYESAFVPITRIFHGARAVKRA